MEKKVKRLFVKIATAVMALTCLLGLCACRDKDGQKPYEHLVTFNYNVGELEVNCEEQYLGVHDDSLIGIQPGYSDAFRLQEIKGYFNEGWYLAETDENGEPVKEANGRVKLGKKWDFEKDKVSSDIVLYANLLQRVKLIISGGDTEKVFEGVPGDVRKEPMSALAPQKTGATFYGYFEDEACSVPFQFPYTFETSDKTIYAKFIEGSWSIVNTASEFINAYSGGGNIYVDEDIDFSGTAWVYGLDYNSEIKGNGHVLKNITCTFEATQNTKTGFGLFGTLRKDAKISDLTIENATVTYKCTYKIVGMKAALFAYGAEAGAQLINVKITGTLKKGELNESADVTLYPFIAIQEDGVVFDGCDYQGVTVEE